MTGSSIGGTASRRPKRVPLAEVQRVLGRYREKHFGNTGELRRGREPRCVDRFSVGRYWDHSWHDLAELVLECLVPV